MVWKLVVVFGLGLLLAAPAAAEKKNPPDKKDADSYVKIDAKGKLQTGVAAIGGETTGVILQTADATVELDIKDKDLRDKAEKLNGKAVVVTGTLTIKRGVEIRQRLIVDVASIKAADEK